MGNDSCHGMRVMVRTPRAVRAGVDISTWVTMDLQLDGLLEWDFAFRIIDWFELEGTLQIIYSSPSRHGQGHLPLDHIAQNSIQPGLEHF